MKSIILTDNQHEDVKQMIILQLRNIKAEITKYTEWRDACEKDCDFNEALFCSHKLSSLFVQADSCYNLLFKLIQS